MDVLIRHRGTFLLLVIASFVLLETEKVSSLRRERDIRLQLLTVHPLRVLEESSSSRKGNLDTSADLAASGFVMSDPNQSVKRMIGRGSDPIHNKEQDFWFLSQLVLLEFDISLYIRYYLSNSPMWNLVCYLTYTGQTSGLLIFKLHGLLWYGSNSLYVLPHTEEGIKSNP
ncbi:hypothetical protein YC2023_111794 [Brassica napus]